MPKPLCHHPRDIESKAKWGTNSLGLSTRLALAMVSLVVVTTAVLSFITYRSVTEAGIPRALDRLSTKARLSASKLEAAVNSARQDMLMVQGGIAVARLIAGRTAVPFAAESDARTRESIALRFQTILSAKPEYAQLRIMSLADAGRELVRVDRGGPGRTVRILPDAELTQLGERDFFESAFGRPGSDVYVSPVAFQRPADGDGPTMPMLHLAIPLRTLAGQPFGISMLDFDLGPKFDGFRAEADSENLVFIANGEGRYLLHPAPSREFAFEPGSMARVQDDFPAFDAAVAGGDSGGGIWTDRNGARFGVGWEVVRLAGGPAITILTAARYADLHLGLAAVSNSALAGGLVAVLLAILLAVGFARSLSTPLVQMTRAVEGLSRGELVAVPSNGGREIGVLSAAFAEMATQLKTKQALLENTIASIGDLVLVANEGGQIVVANPAAQRVLRIVPGTGTTKGTRKFHFFYPDGLTRMPVSSSALARALRGDSVDDLEFIVEPEDLGIPMFMVASARPLKDEFGNLRGAVTVMRDVTEQKRAHQSLVDSQRMAQAIINTALDAFIQIDDKGIITGWSPKAEAMFGWARAEVVGRMAREVIVPQRRRELSKRDYIRFLKEVAAGAPPGWRYEAPALTRDGGEIFVEVSITALRRGDGYIMNAFIRDITAKLAAEEQLIQAQKMESVGQLTGGIAHDFNNMLTVITGTIEILAEGVKDRPQLASIAKMIGDAADRGAALTANLLSFARRQPLQPAKIDVNQLVREAARLLEPTLGRQIEIKTSLSDYLWPAHVDPGQLSSALVNLAINARDAMPDGGKLTFSTNNITLDARAAVARGLDHPGDYVVIEVADTGTGIPEAIRDKIFEPFFSTKETGRGTGLGLSMVFGFAKQSDGNIEVRSEEGGGASFRIYLPRAEAGSLKSQPADNLQSPGGTETILCVEDDASVRAYAIAQLESLGYEVLVASNAAEALAIADTGAEFDLLFTDIVMPGRLNGRQLAEVMVSQRPKLKVLFTSGYTYNALTRHGRVAPDIHLLVKPYRRAELARMLRLCLDPSTDAASDPIPLPYSVQEDLDRFLRAAPK